MARWQKQERPQGRKSCQKPPQQQRLEQRRAQQQFWVEKGLAAPRQPGVPERPD